MLVPRVCVLMSTFNGERYIEEQIDSILNQKGVEITLLIRDDGSSDNTLQICQRYGIRNNVFIYEGDNIGVGRSFIDLLKNAPENDYYAFADQDDVWLADKMISAIRCIKEVEGSDLSAFMKKGYPITRDMISNVHKSNSANIPILYGSNQMIVDKKLNSVGERFSGVPVCDLFSSITRNKIYGCTMVMNRALQNRCKTIELPSNQILKKKNHDAWVLYVAFITGVFIYDKECKILYRQHELQVVGVRKITGIGKIKDKIKRFKSQDNKGIRQLLAEYLLICFGDQMDINVKKHMSILRDVYTRGGLIKLVKDKELVSSFGENRAVVMIRGIMKWI